MSSKKFLKIVLSLSLFVAIFIGGVNYIVDSYGLNSNKNKYINNLTTINNPSVTNLKIKFKADYYLIGTSRVMRIDPNLIEKYLNNKKVYNINISGATFKENSMLAFKLKEQNLNFIYGFDAFSLNKNRLEQKDLINRYNSFKDEINEDMNINTYFSIDYFLLNIKDILKKILKIDLYKYFILENNKVCKVTINGVEEHLDLSNKGNKKSYTNFEIVKDDKILKLAQNTNKNDIFIIYPKHFYHYILFQKYQDIEEKYFSAIKLLVKNTNAQVWSFYGINEITLDEYNFDENGWHFKPKISNLIFAKIFNDKSVEVPEDFGVLVTKDNIDEHLENLRKQIKEYDLNKVLE